MRGALGGAALANNLVNQGGIEAAEKRLQTMPGVTREVAEKTVAEFASMRGMTNQIMLSLADNIRALALATGKDMPDAAKALRDFIQAPAQDGAKFIDSLGASADQVNRFVKAAKEGNGPALSVGLDIFAQRMSVVEQKSGDLAKRIDNVKRSTTQLMTANDEFGLNAPAAMKAATEDAKKLQDAITGNRVADLTAALKTAGASAASLPPSLEQIRLAMDKIGENAKKSKEQILKDQIAFLQSEQAKAQAANSSAEVQIGLESLIGQKRVELAVATRTALTKETEKEKQERFNAIKQEVDATLAGSNERIQALQREVDLATELWGKESSQATGAMRELANARAQFTKQWVEQLAQASDEQIARDNETARESIASARSQYQAKEISLQQSLALEEDAENTRFQQAANGLQDKLRLEEAYPDLVKQVQHQIEANEIEHQKALADIARQGAANMAREYAQSWNGINRQVLSAEESFAQGLFSGRQSLMQSIVNLAARAAEDEIGADLRYWTERQLLAAEGISVESAKEEGGILVHLLGEGQKTAATAAGVAARTAATTAGAAEGQAASAAAGSASILNDAYKAAAGAYAAVVEIPIVGPVLAPIAAGTAFAAVAAFDVLSAAGGQWNVGADGDLYELHKDEMVMPGYLARPMRTAISAMANGSGPAAAGGGGMPDIHAHFHEGADAASILRVLPTVKRALASAVGDALRENPSLRPAFR